MLDSAALQTRSPLDVSSFGPIFLVVIQPTSFCNLNCDYCYLPERTLKNQLSLDLIEPIFKNIFTSPFLRQEFTVCWHAGEPLAVPVQFYESAFAKIQAMSDQFNVNNYRFNYSVQTNGTLINQAWCDLFKAHHVHVGVSLDGPEFLHDRHRKTGQGAGTHAAAMRGISFLQKNDLSVQIICVITEDSLDYPDEIFNFFMEHGLTEVGFNMEELEGVNRTSSLNSSQEIEDKYRAFLSRIWELVGESGGAFKLREFERICHFIYTGERIPRNGLTTPFVILNIDHQGNFSTFDPELLSIKTEQYGDFILGNVLENTFESVCQTEKFQRIHQDIEAGFELCQKTCQYFGVCGGGAASNKYWEHGTFRASETMACRFYEKIVTDIILGKLESSLGLTEKS